jgi:sigma-54 dependent transcriptional regulator, acetoin dehydrogenase operon transcriptional activator AcoR
MRTTRPGAASCHAASLFHSTRAERIELARRRYFEEGVAPSGVVSDAVFQSWVRCQRLHADPKGEVAFEPVTVSRTHLSLQKNRHLRDAWIEELPSLNSALGATSCAAMLVDPSGVLVGATCAGRAHERLMPVATRLGVDLSENAVGTTAPGVVVRTGMPVSVLGAEHYFDDVKTMNCAAAPIRDILGRVAGVLDISTEAIPFSFDAASVVGLFAGAIENRLLVAQSDEHLVVCIQVAASLLDSPVVGLVGIDVRGRLAWCNGVAGRLLGLNAAPVQGYLPSAEEALGMSISALASLPRHGAAAMRLPNGLTIWARSSMRAADGRRDLVNVPRDPAPDDDRVTAPCLSLPPAAEASTSLRESDRDLIERTVKECGGNIASAARQLRVSRGLIYRRLRRWQSTSGQS